MAAPDVSNRPRRRRRLSVMTRLALAVITVTACAVAVASLMGLAFGERAGDRLVERRLDAVRIAETFELAAYLRGVEATVTGLASSPMTSDRITELSDAMRSVEAPTGLELGAERATLLEAYEGEVVPTLAATTGRTPDPRRLIPETPTGIHLQYQFFAPGEDPTEVARTDPSTEAYLVVHGRLDPELRDIADRLGAENVSLIDVAGDVVYSSDRSPDFATNLLVGPYSGQALGATTRRMLAGEVGATVQTDFVLSTAALGHPVRYVAAPVLDPDGGAPIGVFAARFSVGTVDEVLSVGVDRTSGIGDTGEVIAAGADGLLRSDPRAFLESPRAYVDDAVAAGTLTPGQAERALARNSTVLLQRADGDVILAATEGRSGAIERTDHLGRDSIMSFGPIGVGGENWVVITQIAAAEPGGPQSDYRRLLVFISAVIVALTTFGAVAWAQRVTRPMREIGERLGDGVDAATGGSGAAETFVDTDREVDDGSEGGVGRFRVHVTEPGCEDFARLVEGFEAMRLELEERSAEVAEAHRERRRVVRRLLPAPVASRVEAGDQTIMERVPSVSIAVILVRDGIEDELALHRAVAKIDSVADRYGVERVKIIGDACFVAVGHLRPYLDHPRRAVGFADDVLEAAAAQGEHEVSIGVATGTVGVGMVGTHHLVFDVWGPAVNEAERLARRAPTDRVAVSETTRARIPEDLAFDTIEVDDGTLWVRRTERAVTTRSEVGR